MKIATGNNVSEGRRKLLQAAGLMTVAGLAATAIAASAEAESPPADISKLPRVKQKLVAPPFFPEHEQATTSGPKIVEVEMTIEEKKMVVDADGTETWIMAYNGTVPGPMIVVHENDYVELTLKSAKSNTLEHNIDFHAATGALGGGALTKINPGQQVVLRFKATKPGVFVYHCAPGDVMIPYHVVHGMNGAIMVMPRDGLKDAAGKPLKYDRAFFIGEQDYYIARDEKGSFKKYSMPGEDMEDSLNEMRKLIPSHVVFNGAMGSLTGDKALESKVGETILIVHAQANRDTRPHLIGGHGDHVWEAGKFANPPQEGLETWFIRGGSAGAMLYTFRQPGLYAYVNHNLIEAVLLGATAHFKVKGDWNDDLMTQVSKPMQLAG